MSDLISRLRTSDGFAVFRAGDGTRGFRADTDLMVEAADRIEELEAALREIEDHPTGRDMYNASIVIAADRIEELEAALREQGRAFVEARSTSEAAWDMVDIARRALGDNDESA